MDEKSEEAEQGVGSEKKVITEGKAEVLLSSARNVFYNPVQEFNRDLRYVHDTCYGTGPCNRADKFCLNLGASRNINESDFFLLCCNS